MVVVVDVVVTTRIDLNTPKVYNTSAKDILYTIPTESLTNAPCKTYT